ncbi:MAG TPA: sugar phosphate isomerase/epimerase, partial [Dongiaceae bacterium]
MKTLTGPGIFLAQFAQDKPPHNSLQSIARWAKNYGYRGIQIPSWDKRFFDLDKAASSNAYCDE